MRADTQRHRTPRPCGLKVILASNHKPASKDRSSEDTKAAGKPGKGEDGHGAHGKHEAERLALVSGESTAAGGAFIHFECVSMSVK